MVGPISLKLSIITIYENLIQADSIANSSTRRKTQLKDVNFAVHAAS
jgi:hypothetical protein